MEILGLNSSYYRYQTGFKAVNSKSKQLPQQLINNIIDTDITITKLQRKKDLLTQKLSSDISYIDTFMGQRAVSLFKGLKSPKKNLDNAIKGYAKQKVQIKTIFINSINKDDKMKSLVIPPAIMLYGDNLTVNTFIEGMKSELNPEKININHYDITEDFVSEVKTLVENARNQFNETGKRTAVILNKPEQYLSVGNEEAKLLGINIDSTDRNILQANKKNAANILYFKSLLDDVSKLPDKGDEIQAASALTFIMLTENPHLIHPDLISRDGKIKLVDLSIPHDENLKEIILSYVKLPKLLLDNTLWQKLLNELNPNRIKGGLSVNNIEQAYKDAKNSLNYISNLIYSPREFSSETCERFLHINNNMGFFKTKNIDDNINFLIMQKKMGLLSPKSTQILNKKIKGLINELEQLNKLIETGKCSNKTLKRQEQIKEILEKI